MKSQQEIREYKKLYYIHNRNKLCNYSNSYYHYKKCAGDLTEHEIDEKMKLFLKSYKNHTRKIHNDDIMNKIKIKRQNIVLNFN